MADKKPFLVPVVIDDTSERGASVPDKLHEVQWTRLRGGETPPEFVARINRLLSPELPTVARLPTDAATTSAAIPVMAGLPSSLRRALPGVAAVLVLTALVYLFADKLWSARHATPAPPGPPNEATASSSGTSPAAPAAFNPPLHSVAVLPFVNMSGDKDQEYFSDGLTEEILNSLARINELQVSARTSSFSFKGKDADIGTIAHKLNVASILEGSVRRAGNKVRITAQLNNAVTGFHLWSQTYDRDLSNVLQLQTEIANAVANALKVSLLGDLAARIELGGTRSPGAFDAYLRGRKDCAAGRGEDLLSAVRAFTEAIRLDPDYALAFVARSYCGNIYAADWATGAGVQEGLAKAGADARRAIALAPTLAGAHNVLAFFYLGVLELHQADEEYARARAMEPGNADILLNYGTFATQMGRTEEGLAAVRQAIQLDPLSAGPRGFYGYALYLARHYEEAVATYDRALSATDDPEDFPSRGLVYYALGNLEAARHSCAGNSGDVDTAVCLSVTYHKLGRLSDAKSTLEKFRKLRGDADAYAYAEIYAQWGDFPRSLEWLEKALRLRDTGLILLKTDPLVDPLRKEPRFQAVVRELKFPD
jgi:TolB-like protein/cytochrome c-type biogenesis protein CcmH/NrfG